MARFVLPLQEFSDKFKRQDHAWKHKDGHFILMPDEDAQIFNDSAYSHLGIAPCMHPLQSSSISLCSPKHEMYTGSFILV